MPPGQAKKYMEDLQKIMLQDKEKKQRNNTTIIVNP
jgi:hypothetical protein